MILHGCRWRIGDGSNVRIMMDSLLKGDKGKWLQSHQNQGVYNMHVNQLIVIGERHWDIDI